VRVDGESGSRQDREEAEARAMGHGDSFAETHTSTLPCLYVRNHGFPFMNRNRGGLYTEFRENTTRSFITVSSEYLA
jgi:hypothetical protein